jgi:hypothetical protein
VNLRILPLFEGPPERDYAAFHVGEGELAAALSRLFNHHISSPYGVQLDPLDEWLVTVVRSRLGISVQPYDRRRQGDSVFVVRPNGDVFQTNEIGDDALALGNLGRDLQEMLTSVDEASARRSEEIRPDVQRLSLLGGCDGCPAHTEKFAVEDGRRCPVACGFEHMDHALDRMSLGAAELRRLADDDGEHECHRRILLTRWSRERSVDR